MKYTKQQQTAIDARNSSIIVSAAAGSGKTAVLTERILELIRKPENGEKSVSADKMIVVTFAKDAANGMKSKLDKKLRELINSDNISDDEREHLLKQQILLQNAKISTINSFCFDLLRDNITEQGITSGFDILDETESNIIKSQAMDELLDFYSKDKESKEYSDISMLYDYFCIKDYKPLTRVIMLIEKFLSSVALREEWLETAEKLYSVDFKDSIYYKKLFEDTLEKTIDISERYLKNQGLIDEIAGEKAVEKTKKQAEEDFEAIEHFLNILKSGSLPSESDFEYIGKSFGNLKSVSKKERNEALYEVYKDTRTDLKKDFFMLVNRMKNAEEIYKETAKIIDVLFNVVRKYLDIIWEKKCSKNAISFDDGERLALELLIEKDENGRIKKDAEGRIFQSEIAKRLADMYDVIMIDEYQDSNNKQDLIFKLISKNFKYSADGSPMYGDNVFLVGDVKQSIYEFRLANPRNFIDVMQKSKPYSENENSKNKSIFLNTNFRSSEETIKFVNFIFGNIMSEKFGGINYNDNNQLNFGATERYSNTENKYITKLMLIDTDAIKPNKPNDNQKKSENFESAEAEVIAGKIKKMIDERVEIVEEDGKKRVCEAKDFCILLRSNSPTNVYVRALEKRGIHARGSEEAGYLKSQEIAILIDLLRVIANPLQDVPLTSVMFSPMYMFSLEEIAYIKSKAIDKESQKIDRKKLLYQVIIEAINDDIEDFEPALKEKCRYFVESLNKFRFDSVTMTVGELITSIYDNTDFMSVMQLYKDGDKKRANLRMLIKYAQDYEKFASAEGRGGLSGFIYHIDRISKESDYNQGKVFTGSRNFVTVQTIHKSKGLQYPFVFICETSTKFQYDNYSVFCKDDGRIGFTWYNKKNLHKYKTFQHLMIKDEKVRDIKNEEMRLLYVAMTRTEQQLFITLKCDDEAKKELSENLGKFALNSDDIGVFVSSAKSFSDWLWLCLMLHRKFYEIAGYMGLNIVLPSCDIEEELFDVEYFDKIDSVSMEEEEEIEDSDEKLTESLINLMQLDSKYNYEDSESPEKLTVIQIVEKLRENKNTAALNSDSLKNPAFMLESKISGSERGTAIHTFFQYCNFASAEKNADDEITRLCENGFLTKIQSDIVRENISKIQAFFKSNLYSKIKSSANVEREKKFLIKFSDLHTNGTVFDGVAKPDVMIKGVVDLVYEEADGLVVVDYKSDKIKSAEILSENYKNQLEFYRLAVELITGKKVKKLFIYSVEIEREIEI